ncbi:hypothetical protein TNCV_5002081 [Trichonephila clavipes]|nr:hypothetical protein TNCV_5002081 [Trichonephila clavipes]
MEKSVYRVKQCTIKKKKFSQGRSNIVDENQSGRSFLIATKSTEQQGREFIRADRRVTVTVRWLHRLLIEEHETNQIGSCFHLFGPQKTHLEGKQLADDNEVQHEVLMRMKQQP